MKFYFNNKVLSWHLTEKTENNHKNTSQIKLVLGQNWKLVPPK